MFRKRVRDVALVPGKGFVAAVSGERDRDVTACLFADQERRQCGLVAERLVVGAREPGQRFGDVLVERELLVNGPVPIRDGLRVRTLVVVRVGEPDRERAHRNRGRLCHKCDDDARVDPAGEKRSEWNVGLQPRFDRLANTFANALEPFVFAERLRPDLRRPVRLDPLGLSLRDQHVSWEQASDPGESGAIARNVLQRQVGVDGFQVDFAPHSRQSQQRLQLGRERERSVIEARPDEWFLAETIPRKHEPLA